MLVVPERFNKNAPDVQALGPSAETGRRLIEYLCERIGIADLGHSDVLDFGCGCRFADSIVNCRLPVKSYTGIDIDQAMIDFLVANIDDRRLQFIGWNAKNPNSNPTGTPLNEYQGLPVGERDFDIICMFSVITHQLPEDAEIIFRLLRRHIRHGGHLFFSADVQDMEFDYKEMVPGAPTAHSAYSLALLNRLLERTKWQMISCAPKNPRPLLPILDSLLCVPIE